MRYAKCVFVTVGAYLTLEAQTVIQIIVRSKKASSAYITGYVDL